MKTRDRLTTMLKRTTEAGEQLTSLAERVANAHQQVTVHAEEAIRIIDQIEARQAKAHEARLATIDAMLAAIDAFIKPKEVTK